ncbi:hypothetical protein KJ657_00545 [Patescibacteria group bacterium]|nr:hypothetical protein [Patescibacteria group bacterium]MBU1015565.1 hypothetical protein [Patescibacteria group bacterium]MBU1685616.1 hypothetical protein [Patescibacteria group bacterium]MBU1938966.1 hypothetical protein [Patescibacteria group bacterium]
MARDFRQIDNSNEGFESAESDVLTRVLDRNRMTQIRHEIGMIAERSYHENLISDEAYEGYLELAEGREEHEVGAEMLENTRKFAEKHEAKAIRIYNKIRTAVSQKIASEDDEEFLMEKLVIDNIRFAEQSEAVEGLIDQKLARMKQDKERYKELANHDLIQDVGYLKVDGGTRIDFPGEDEFLELTVPERRELLKKLEAALPKAEAYAEEQEEKEDEELVAGYIEKLDGALEEGIIGQHTYNRFLNGFKKIDRKEKECWNKEFDAQMKRYRTLWTQIRGTLQGEALEKMEGMIDQSGYSDLFKTFGQLKKAESHRLTADYTKALKEYQKEGIIGQHTVDEFVIWMNQRDLACKYEAGGKLESEMVRYEKLWQDIAELPKRQQKFLRSKIDVWGYTKLDQEYKKLLSGTSSQPSGIQTAEASLSQIRSKEVREAITETDDILTEQGIGKRGGFLRIVDKMFNQVNRNTFDATSFETELRKKTMKVNPEVKRDIKGRGADDEVDFEQIDNDTGILEESGKARINESLGFIQIESKAANDGAQRETQVTINEEQGMDRFLAEDSKNSYRAKEADGQDDLSLAVYTDAGRTVELDLHEVRVLKEYLKQKEAEQLDEAG